MKLLLDTHVLLWAVESPERLGSKALKLLKDANTPLYVSTVSGFEIATKYAIGKLKLPVPPAEYVASRCKRLGVSVIGLTMEQATTVGSLPLYHRDPFDRLLIAQAVLDGYTIISADKMFKKYKVRVIPSEK